MFYCNKCAKEYGYPETFSKSFGRCEICKKEAECNDRPSSSLPMPKKQVKDKKSCKGQTFTLTEEELRKEIKGAFIHGQGNTLYMEAGLERDETEDYVNSTMIRLLKTLNKK